ncbi:LysE/ArgO family amino acid transporter [Paraburkholderia sp. J12]|uniref:LysE/ArgO family amino acid transporter n=1 Tax=Paraburkholderia sp. J12 TaxID=2805432 RepID=UPI002ABE63A8|nr:LysE family transporter [Paraburkholderia sp. J12]
MLDASTLDFPSFIEGLLLGAGLFASVGPKDAFVIKRSLTSRYLFLIAAVCAGSDALLIALGAGGFAAVLARHPAVVTVSLWCGVAWLAGHGVLALRAAVAGERSMPSLATLRGAPFGRTLFATAAVSLLNPSAWIDTVLVIGAIVAARAAPTRAPFALGAVAASFVWFLCLTYGSRSFRALFTRPAAWRVLDAFVALMMFGMAAHLALGQR